jgi:hypothetical protein
MAHGFPPPLCTGKKFIQDENIKPTATMYRNIAKSGVKHHKPPSHPKIFYEIVTRKV